MRGVTLVELLVVLVLLGVMAGVSAVAVGSLRPPAGWRQAQELARTRAEAIRTGRALTVTTESSATVRFLPDGRAIGQGVDLLTGEVLDARR